MNAVGHQTAGHDTAGRRTARRRGGRGRRVLGKLALSAGSLFLVLLLLELGFRLFGAPPELWQVRPGVYHHTLPVVNGIKTAKTPVPTGRGPDLPTAKEAGELRVFVFGESSVQGAPWGLVTSPPAMLRDELAKLLPDRTVNVVNMGRGSSMTLDAYYYLLGVVRFSPDVIIFYQGTNDEYERGTEMCAPLRSPGWHGLWRWVVRRSWLLWSVRVHGPALFGASAEGGSGGDDESKGGCDRHEGFRAMTRLLLLAAADTGAQVIVATPVESELTALEFHQSRGRREAGFAASVAGATGVYRELLVCLLDAGCELPRLLAERLATRSEQRRSGHSESEDALDDVLWRREHLAALGRIWKENAEATGATVIDFATFLRRRQPESLLLPPVLVDSVHLSLPGYLLLARLWATATAALVEGRPVAPLEELAPAELNVASYVTLQDESGSRPFCQILIDEGKHYCRRGGLLFGVGLLKMADEHCRDGEARAVLGWSRRALGLPPGLSPEEDAALDNVDVDQILREPGAR